MTTTGARRAAALIALAIAAGCAGGSSDSSSEPAPPTSAEPAPAATTTTVHEIQRQPMVVDTDLAGDDLVALFYLASDPRVELLAVTVSGTGEVTCPRGVDVARAVLTVAGVSDVEVACGRSTPLSGNRTFPSEWRTAVDAGSGLNLTIATDPAPGEDASGLLIRSVERAAGPMTLLTLGPLTNVAVAVTAEPAIIDRLGEVIVMGGAVDVPGNVFPGGASTPLAAEWNLYIDPEATAIVLGSMAKITLVPLDATNEVPVDEAVIDRIAANNTTAATDHVLQLLSGAAGGGRYLWDPLAAVAATDPELFAHEQATVSVATEGDQAGQTRRDPDGETVLIAKPKDSARVLDHLLRTLAAVPEGEALVTPTTLPIVGEATLSFDGTTCSYDGPTAPPAGRLRITVATGSVPFAGVVAQLAEGATLEEVLAWAAAHPNEQPPGIDVINLVGDTEGLLPSPADIELGVGTTVMACVTETGIPLVGAELDVGG